MSNIPDSTFFKWTIKDAIVDALYKSPLTRLKAEQYTIVQQNHLECLDADKSKYETYVYLHSKRYYSRDIGLADLTYDANALYKSIELLPTYKELLINNIAIIEELNHEQIQINTYLNCILNKSETVADMYKLLPTSARRLLQLKETSIITLAPEEIAQCQKDTYKYAMLLNERILLNLLNKD